MEWRDLVLAGCMDSIEVYAKGCRSDGGLVAQLVRYGSEHVREIIWAIHSQNKEREEFGGECCCGVGGRNNSGHVLGMGCTEVWTRRGLPVQRRVEATGGGEGGAWMEGGGTGNFRRVGSVGNSQPMEWVRSKRERGRGCLWMGR